MVENAKVGRASDLRRPGSRLFVQLAEGAGWLTFVDKRVVRSYLFASEQPQQYQRTSAALSWVGLGLVATLCAFFVVDFWIGLKEKTIDRTYIIAEYSKAFELSAQNSTAYLELARALQRKGRYDEAEVEYKRALDLDAQHATAYLELARALQGKGRYDEAIAEYHRAIEAYAQNATAKAEIMAQFAPEQRRWIEFYDRNGGKVLFRENDQKATIHYELGRALQQKGRDEEAIAEYQKALAIQPDYPEVKEHLDFAMATPRRNPK